MFELCYGMRSEMPKTSRASCFITGSKHLKINGSLNPKKFAHFNRLFEAKRDPLFNVLSQYIS